MGLSQYKHGDKCECTWGKSIYNSSFGVFSDGESQRLSLESLLFLISYSEPSGFTGAGVGRVDSDNCNPKKKSLFQVVWILNGPFTKHKTNLETRWEWLPFPCLQNSRMFGLLMLFYHVTYDLGWLSVVVDTQSGVLDREMNFNSTDLGTNLHLTMETQGGGTPQISHIPGKSHSGCSKSGYLKASNKQNRILFVSC